MRTWDDKIRIPFAGNLHDLFRCRALHDTNFKFLEAACRSQSPRNIAVEKIDALFAKTRSPVQ
jgi:hypothetical protein